MGKEASPCLRFRVSAACSCCPSCWSAWWPPAPSFQHPPPTLRSRKGKIQRAVGIALHQIGDPYRYGAAGPNAFDCSGLVNYSYRKAGFRHVPRTSDAQARWGHKVRKSHLRRGDLMFFHSGGNVYHAAIFLKRNRNGSVVMLDSAKPGTRVHRRHPWTDAVVRAEPPVLTHIRTHAVTPA